MILFGKIKNKVKSYNKREIIDKSRNELIDHFIISLDVNKLNSDEAYQYIKFIKVLRLILGIAFYVIGLAIIVIPLPKVLEIQTLFRFNVQDGITVSDLIGLMFLAVGSYHFLKISKKT